MNINSKYFDKIRVKSGATKPVAESTPQCEWPGCPRPGPHKAPKGRDAEGQFFHYCTAHVQEYNKSYNYFKDMKDDEVETFRKEAQTGHRPTWKLGRGATATVTGTRRKVAGTAKDPFELFHQAKEKATGYHPKGRALRNTELKALQTLGLDSAATPDQVKTQYKTLVKRLHPDANGGSRANEDTLKTVIQAYDHLRSSGFV